jgi:hypothetical protein
MESSSLLSKQFGILFAEFAGLNITKWLSLLFHISLVCDMFHLLVLCFCSQCNLS